MVNFQELMNKIMFYVVKWLWTWIFYQKRIPWIFFVFFFCFIFLGPRTPGKWLTFSVSFFQVRRYRGGGKVHVKSQVVKGWVCYVFLNDLCSQSVDCMTDSGHHGFRSERPDHYDHHPPSPLPPPSSPPHHHVNPSSVFRLKMRPFSPEIPSLSPWFSWFLFCLTSYFGAKKPPELKDRYGPYLGFLLGGKWNRKPLLIEFIRVFVTHPPYPAKR